VILNRGETAPRFAPKISNSVNWDVFKKYNIAGDPDFHTGTALPMPGFALLL
jgi:hypothetical protein